MKFLDIRNKHKHSLSRVLILSLSIVILCALYCVTDCRADDVSLSELFDSVSFNIQGGLYYQTGISSEFGTVLYHSPDYLARRRKLEPELQSIWHLDNDYISDQPLIHTATFIEFMARLQKSKSLIVNASLTMEHRGFSGGTYNTNMIIAYPMLNIDYHTISNENPFGIDGVSSQLKLEIGDFRDIRYYEGLEIYNMDLQGVRAYVQLGKFRLSHLHMADFIFGYGLYINDWVDFALSVEQVSLGKGVLADFKLGIASYAQGNDGLFGFENSGPDVLNFSAGFQISDELRYYGQLGYRYVDYDYDTDLLLAGLIGGEYKHKNRIIHIDSRIEFRHYGGIFNYQLRSEETTHFRDTEEDDMHNFVGDQLYPIALYERPFGQWAVFAEYHKRYVQGLTIYTKLRYYIGKSQFLYGEIDCNTIFAEGEDAFTYPFYKAGIAFQAGDNNYLLFSLTNKVMNLDKHYPTFYCAKSQMVQVEARRMFDWGD